jgi:hypothetical protein
MGVAVIEIFWLSGGDEGQLPQDQPDPRVSLFSCTFLVFSVQNLLQESAGMNTFYRPNAPQRG